MEATVYQIHVDQLMSTIRHLKDTHKILVYHLGQLAETKSFLERQGQKDKSQLIRIIVTLKKWIQQDIVGLMDGGSSRFIASDHAKK